MSTGSRVWRRRGALLALVAAWIVASGCGPGASRRLAGERLLDVEDPRWRLNEVAISPDGRWAAAAALGSPDHGPRIFLVDLESGRSFEALPTRDARAEFLIEAHPGIEAMEWDEGGTQVRFPARYIGRGGTVVSNSPSGRKVELDPVLPRNAPWLEVHLVDGHPGDLVVNDSREARMRPVNLPVEFDPRLKVEIHSRSNFDLLDHERGGRRIARFRGYMNWLNPDTASISPDGNWVAITVGREAFGFKGARGFLLDRQSGKRGILADWIVYGVRWHPSRRELFGVEKDSDGRWVLMRWRY